MLVFLDIGEDVNFIDRAFFQFFILFESPDFDDFDRILFIIVFVDGPVNLSIGSLAYNFVEGIVFDDPYHFKELKK